MKRVVVVTDCTDVAANELRATLIKELKKLGKEESVAIEPFVFAQEFSVINGAFLIRLISDSYPPDEIVFLVVLNPLKTSREERARLVGETENGIQFVGENTSTLGWLIRDYGLKAVYETSQAGLDGKRFISFGGKYIHAPIAARVAAGMPLEKLGEPFDRRRLAFPDLKQGTVVHVDNFGVVKIYGSLGNPKEGDEFEILVNGKSQAKATFSNAMKNLPDDTLALFSGSSLTNLPELGKVRHLNTAKELGIKIGDTVSWKPYRSKAS